MPPPLPTYKQAILEHLAGLTPGESACYMDLAHHAASARGCSIADSKTAIGNALREMVDSGDVVRAVIGGRSRYRQATSLERAMRAGSSPRDPFGILALPDSPPPVDTDGVVPAEPVVGDSPLPEGGGN